MAAPNLIVRPEDILKAVKIEEENRKRALRAARARDRAEGRPPRPVLYPDRPQVSGPDVVLDFIKNPNRRELRAHTSVRPRGTSGSGNGYIFETEIPMVRNRALADKIQNDLDRFLDYILDEYDIPKRYSKRKVDTNGVHDDTPGSLLA